MRNFHLIIAIFMTQCMFALAQNKKVAVYVMGEDAGINKVLGSKLVSAIARSEEYTAIERTAAFLAELNKEQKYQRTGAVDDRKLSRLGKQFGVQYICVAAVSEAFNEKYLSARLIDVESAQVERTASSSGAIQSLTDVVNAADAISNDLLSSLAEDRQSSAKKVAVYVVKNDAGKDIGKVLGDKLVAGFTNSGRYVAIERTNSFLTQLSKEHKYERTGAVDDNDISRLGKQFGVQYVCVADVSDVLGEKFISARLIDVETAEVVNTHDVGGEMKSMNNCLEMANEIANNLSMGTFAEQQKEARIEVERKGARRRAEYEAASSQTITVNGVSFKMIRVEGGSFTMGATSEQGNDAEDDERPTHMVNISTFYIGETEVTQELWQAVMGSNPSSMIGSNRPVEQVSWNDCQSFISELNSLTGKNFRLPTEAEWEYAARGGNKSQGYKYSGSNILSRVAWYKEYASEKYTGSNILGRLAWYKQNTSETRPVKAKFPNELGLYDMSGNVCEWCDDWYGSYSSSAQTDPTGPSSGVIRVYRGGGWYNNATYCRVADRNMYAPAIRSSNVGFRLAL